MGRSSLARSVSPELRRAAASFFFKLISSPLERACRLLVILVAAPALGATAFGIYQFASTVTTMLAAATELGLGTWTTRSLSRARGHEHEHEHERMSAGGIMIMGIWLRGALILPYFLLVAVAAATQAPGDERTAMLVFGVTSAAGSLIDFFGAILRGREDFRQEATLNATRAVATTLGALAALELARSLLGLSFGMALGALLSLAFGAYFLRDRYKALVPAGGGSAPSRATAGSVLHEAVPLWLTGLLAMLYFRSDIILVRYFAGDAEVGAYAAAYRIFEATLVLPSAAMAVAFPRLARARDPEARATKLELVLLASLAAVGAAVAGVILVADDRLVRLLLGSTFDRSAVALRVLALTVPVMYVTFALCFFVIARGRERAFAKVLGGMLVLNVGLNLALVPTRGGVGAAWATLFTELALVFACAGLLALGAGRAAPRGEAAS